VASVLVRDDERDALLSSCFGCVSPGADVEFVAVSSSCSMSLPVACTGVLNCFPGFTSKSCSMM
jgi:hypothetical protein